MQKAVDIQYDKMQGTLSLGELNQLLAEGWVVVTTDVSGGGDILVILQMPNEKPKDQ